MSDILIFVELSPRTVQSYHHHGGWNIATSTCPYIRGCRYDAARAGGNNSGSTAVWIRA